MIIKYISRQQDSASSQDTFLTKKGKKIKKQFHWFCQNKGFNITEKTTPSILGFKNLIKYFNNFLMGKVLTCSRKISPDNKPSSSAKNGVIRLERKFIVSGSADKSIKVLNLETKQLVHHFPNAHEGQVNSVAVSPDGKYIVSACKDHSIKIFDLETMQEVHHFNHAHQDDISCVIVSPDSKYIISSSYDKSIKILDIKTKQEVHHFVGAHDGI